MGRISWSDVTRSHGRIQPDFLVGSFRIYRSEVIGYVGRKFPDSLVGCVRNSHAIIAATAQEKNEVLLTGNNIHYSFIPNIQLKIFKPE